MSPPIAIFWSKNFDGMQDVAQVEVTRADNIGTYSSMTPEQIAKQIEQDIPIDTQFKELSDN